MSESKKSVDACVACLREEVQSFEQYTAGLSIEEIQEKYGLSQVVKLASNENPLGTSPLVQKTLRQHADHVFRYPQTGNPRLAKAIADYVGVPAECIVAGNGSDELIDLIIRCRVRPGKEHVLAFDPCFSMYRLQSQLCGVEFRQLPLNAEDYSFPWDTILDAVDENTGVLFLTSPDNPSGYTAPLDKILEIAKALPPQCLFVLDEAYIDFTQPPEAHSPLVAGEFYKDGAYPFPNMVTLRTFSKMFGLAGLRLGYAVCAPWLADFIWRIRDPFSVNLMAELAGIAALADTHYFQATLECVQNGKAQLEAGLQALKCRTWPTQANFMLVALPEDCPLDRNQVHQALLAKGVIIRPLNGYCNMERHFRLSIGTAKENDFFLEKLAEVLRGV